MLSCYWLPWSCLRGDLRFLLKDLKLLMTQSVPWTFVSHKFYFGSLIVVQNLQIIFVFKNEWPTQRADRYWFPRQIEWLREARQWHARCCQKIPRGAQDCWLHARQLKSSCAESRLDYRSSNSSLNLPTKLKLWSYLEQSRSRIYWDSYPAQYSWANHFFVWRNSNSCFEKWNPG